MSALRELDREKADEETIAIYWDIRNTINKWAVVLEI